MAIDLNDDEAPAANVLPPIKPATAQAIADALFHQYGVDCSFVICVMPKADAEMVEQTPKGETLERQPRACVASASLSTNTAEQLLGNTLEFFKAAQSKPADDPIGETKGNG